MAEELHSAFVKTHEAMQAVWEKGWADGAKKGDGLGPLNRLRRGIGSIRTAPLASRTVSWLYCLTPEAALYYSAFDARKKYKPDDEVARLKSAIPQETTSYPVLCFYGQITLLPSFGGPRGTIDRTADPNDLKDVRIVLKVGDRIYQPREQPGDLLQNSGVGANSFSVPHFEVTRASGDATVRSNSGGYATATVEGTAVRQYTTYHEESYDWYSGAFVAYFDLISPDGTARLKPTDKEFTVIVVYGDGERRVTYKLQDLAKL